MKKDAMIKQLKDMLKDMLPIMELCEIQIKHYQLPDNINDFHVDIIKEAFNWIIEAYKSYEQYKKIRALCTEEVWKGYTQHGDCHDLREVKLLKQATIVMRAYCNINTKPMLFQKKRRNVENKKLQSTDKQKD